MRANWRESPGQYAGNGVSVVVPVFNSASTIGLLVDEISSVLETVTDDFEIVLVNDGSKDTSWQVICETRAMHDFIKAVNLTRNYGQHNALLCGIRHATKRTIVTLDDDLQNPPFEIPKMLQMLEEGYDVVYGVPIKPAHGLTRALTSVTAKLVLEKAMGADTARQIGSFRAFRTELREAFAGAIGPFVNLDILLTWATDRFATARVHHHPRMQGRSKYTFGKLITHTVNMITGFSVLPLQLASFCGLVFLVIGLVGVTYSIVIYFAHNGARLSGFGCFISAVLTFSGVHLMALGIIGEYLARMYVGTMGKPTYIVRTLLEPSGYENSAYANRI